MGEHRTYEHSLESTRAQASDHQKNQGTSLSSTSSGKNWTNFSVEQRLTPMYKGFIL